MAYHDRDATSVRTTDRIKARIEPPLALLGPRRTPRQARARATFAAIVDACAQLMASGGYDALTTNAISERAGVSVGTLYEYFPNREAIVVALTTEACSRLVERMTRAVGETDGMTRLQGAEHLIRAGVETLGAPRNGFKALMREAPFVLRLPVFHEARKALDLLSQDIRRKAGEQLHLPEPQADAWLISQMLFNAMLEIAFLDNSEAERALLVRQLAQLTFRMAVGRDASAQEMSSAGHCARGRLSEQQPPAPPASPAS
jgi:AcrR family transcriptional regulator